MMFKNSLRLIATNFDKVWKLLVYHIFSIALAFGLIAVFYQDYLTLAKFAYQEADLASIFQSGTIFGSSIANALTGVADFVIIFFKQLFAFNIWKGIYFCFIVFYFFPVLVNIGKYVTCEMMYGYMSSCRKQSFTGTYLKTLGSSLVYSLIKVLYSLPFNALVVLSMWGLTRVENHIFDYIMPFAFVLIPALVLGIKSLFNMGWAPAKVVYNHNIISSYTIGIRAVIRRSAEVFSSTFIFYLLAIVISIALGAYSLIIILPIMSPFIYIFEMVMFFSSQGMRFYVDTDTIISPKRLEEVDKIDDAKYLL